MLNEVAVVPAPGLLLAEPQFVLLPFGGVVGLRAGYSRLEQCASFCLPHYGSLWQCQLDAPGECAVRVGS